MKKSILFLIIIVNGVCFGQKKDSVAIISKWTSATYATPANGIGMTISGVLTSTEPKQDTIACLMLVCDTLKRASGYMWFDSTGAKGEEILNTSPEVWWKPGFVIYKYYQRNGWDVQEPIYLDRRKKPLDSWIVVWLTKEIK